MFSISDFDWTVTPSDASTREFGILLERIRPLLAPGAFVFRFDETKELSAFIRKNFVVGRESASRLSVTRNNFVFVYNRWREAVKPSIAVDWDGAKKRGIVDADFFLADLLSKDGATNTMCGTAPPARAPARALDAGKRMAFVTSWNRRRRRPSGSSARRGR